MIENHCIMGQNPENGKMYMCGKDFPVNVKEWDKGKHNRFWLCKLM